MYDTNLFKKSVRQYQEVLDGGDGLKKPNRVTPEVLWGELILSMCFIRVF